MFLHVTNFGDRYYQKTSAKGDKKNKKHNNKLLETRMLNYRDRSQTRRQTLHETLAHAKQYETMM
jgi:hypothetical protein